ncbi:MAG: hypothetical protein CM15mV3_2170 [Caudoviricetes sp.]|nr:MAG: hypothetical protein CM15mV3_2170 [Caudoviricetes sp.]
MYMTTEDIERYGYETYAERAKNNGRVAMLGFLAAVISYATTGSIFSSVPLASRKMIPHFYQLIFTGRFTMTPEAEKFNGWAAMLGIVAAFGSYATTGQLIPGIW